MQRRSFFKLAGITSMACVAAPMLSACESLPSTTPTPEGTSVVSQPEVLFTMAVDVLVLGSGVAGLSAAIAPSQAKRSVLVAEKLDVLGGESYESNGVMDVVGSKLQQAAGITETCDDTWPDRKKSLQNAGVTDLDFAKTLYYGAPDWVDLLQESYGAQFADPSTYRASEANRRRVLPRNGIGDTENIMMPLRDKLAEAGVQFKTGYSASAFILDENSLVCGVRFTTTKESQSVIDVSAKAVVVATGGFASNQALMRDYLPDWQRVGCYTAASMGEGQRMCLTLGGQLGGMDVTPSLTSDLPQAAAWSMFATTLVVDAQGNRFANEDYMHTLAETCFKQERGYFWTIFDSRISESGQSRSAAQVTAKNPKRVVGPASSVEELASLMGLPAEVLKNTFSDYNAKVAVGRDDAFGRQQFLEELQPPLYALKQFPVRFRTRGGAVVDAGGRLLDSAGKTITGVYCCGAAAAGSGDGLATNGAFGLMVGKTVVEDLAE